MKKTESSKNAKCAPCELTELRLLLCECILYNLNYNNKDTNIIFCIHEYILILYNAGRIIQ